MTTKLNDLWKIIIGDIGQSAVLNAIHNIANVPPPRGEFNDTVCPREYVLYQHPDPSKEIFTDSAAWSYLTEAEIRGGLDGTYLFPFFIIIMLFYYLFANGCLHAYINVGKL